MRRFLTLFAAVLALMTVVMATQATLAVGHSRVKVEVLVRGAPIHGANGLAVGSHGRLYVASVFGREIVVVNSRTGRILDRLGPDEGYNGADDLTFGPDGSLYWTDILAGKVGRLETDGTMTWQYVAPFVNPITFSDDGRLFVAQAFYGDALYELDPELAAPAKLMMTGSGIPPFLDQFNGFDFGPDGMLYAPHPFLGSIVRVDVDAGTQEVVANGLPFPVAVKFDAKGRLYAALQDAGTVVHVKLPTGKTRVVARLEPGLDNLAFDACGRLFVSHGGNGHIWRILLNSHRRHHRCVELLVRGGLVSPGGIAVMPSKHGGERLYVADGWEMKKYDGRSGRYEGVIRQSFVGASIISPVTVSPDGANLIVSSWFSNAVQIWDPKKSTEVDRWDDFVVPMNAIRFGDDLIVAELLTVPGQVVRQAPDGTRTTARRPDLRADGSRRERRRPLGGRLGRRRRVPARRRRRRPCHAGARGRRPGPARGAGARPRRHAAGRGGRGRAPDAHRPRHRRDQHRGRSSCAWSGGIGQRAADVVLQRGRGGQPRRHLRDR